jgi:DNA-binding winged helix-turn-helix (wHTH) protein
MNQQISAIDQPITNASAAKTPAFPDRYARFGRFHIDLHEEELYQDGQRAKIQAKLYQTLLFLIGSAGEIIKREQLSRHVWPDNLNRNLEANVNTTMNKLRQVLGDSTDNPVYIETIPRRGYCFIAPVEFSDFMEATPPKRAVAEEQASPVATSGDTATAHVPYSPAKALHVATLVLAGMLMGAALVLVWSSLSGRNHRVQSRTEFSAPSQQHSLTQ